MFLSSPRDSATHATLRLVGVLVGLLIGPLIGVAGALAQPASAAHPPSAGPPADENRCRLDPAYLPHTADAIEAWFRSCHARTMYLPRTADAVDGWRSTRR